MVQIYDLDNNIATNVTGSPNGVLWTALADGSGTLVSPTAPLPVSGTANVLGSVAVTSQVAWTGIGSVLISPIPVPTSGVGNWNGVGSAFITGIKPDGTNAMPSLDAVSRPGFQKITDGVETANVDVDGNLNVYNSNGLSIAKGELTGHTVVHKFGNAPDFDFADNEVSIWDGADDGTTWEKMVYNYSTSADIISLSSDNTNDDQDYEVQGLDTDFNMVTQTITANGLVRVLIPTALIRVFRVKNVGTTDNAGHIFVFKGTAVGGTVAGVPSTVADIRAIIQPGNNQTLMAIYTIPNGKTGYLTDFYMASAGASKNIAYIVKLWVRTDGGVFQLKHQTSVDDSGTSYAKQEYQIPPVYSAKTDLAITVQCGAAATAASFSAGFNIILVDD